jgi:hypothetical protein
LQTAISNVTSIFNWHRIPDRYKENAGDPSKALRIYQLDIVEYRFVQTIQKRLGGKLSRAGIAIELRVCGAISTLTVSDDEREIIEETAHHMRVLLPKDD